MIREAVLLRWRLLTWLAVLLLLSLASVVASYFVASGIADYVYDRALIEIADELSLHLWTEGGSANFSLPPTAERLLLLAPSGKIGFRISTESGATIAGDPTLPLPAGSRGEDAPVGYRSFLHGQPVSQVLVRVTAPDRPNGPPVLVQVAETESRRRALVQEILVKVALPQVLLIIAVAMLLWVSVGKKLSSLRRLKQAVEHRSYLDLSPIPATGAPSEVRPLLHAFNELMVRLSEVLSFQTRFIADAAHQLRTPVAGLKANIEVLLRTTGTTAIRQPLDQSYQSVTRLSRLVSQLLSLARNEPSAARAPDFTPVDLNQMMLNLAARWVPKAYQKSIDLGFEGAEREVLVSADALRLEELATNLSDNAVRYTRRGGRITVRVSDHGRPAISISDDGRRIPPEERERIFQRFHRLLGTQEDGSGLGLAIVREIAELHGAEVELTDDTDGIGNRFTVLFPALSTGPA